MRRALHFQEGAAPDAFELADTGTHLLDEIGEMPALLQAKLLRVIEERAVRRLGSRKEIEVDVRLLAATNRQPQQAVSEGTLRSDLLYRLNVFGIHLPSLRERTEDLPLLAQHLVTIAAPVDGNVTGVFAHEGQRVAVGDVLGTMNDWEWRTDLAASEAKYQQAMLVMQNDLAHGAPQAGADRAQVEFLRSEVARARTRVESAQLRSPISGVVITPNLQNSAGKHLDAGTQFAQVLDLSSAVLQIAVPERDTALMSVGQTAALKLDTYPQRTWHGQVSVVSPQAHAGDGERTFSVEVPLSNPDASLRAGMSGRAKISIGWRPAGYVLLRRPALWIWQTLWTWIGW